MIGWTFENVPEHIVVRCRECGGAATMEDPFIQVDGRVVKEDLLAAHTTTRVGGSVIVERYPDAIRWSQARGARFYLMDGAAGVVSCTKCVSRHSHTLRWPSDAFYFIQHRSKVLWAWNREYLVMVRDFIESSTRDTAGSYYLRRKIPKFFLLAKNRAAVVSKINRFLESS
jgi:hypothetical protein